MDKSLIITPTGCPMFYDDEYDRENHWRFVKPERTYEVCVIGFKEDYVPEQTTKLYVAHQDYAEKHSDRNFQSRC